MARLAHISEEESVGTRFIAALVRQDWAGLETCLDDSIRFRALIPPGLREAEDRASAAGYFKRWFGDAVQVSLLTSEVRQLQDRLAMSYRLRLLEDEWYVAEQQIYCDVEEGRIRHMDLLCSGFRLESEPYRELEAP